jgi:hypothetical protein
MTSGSSKSLAVDFLPIAPSRPAHIQWHMQELAYDVSCKANSLGVQLDPQVLANLMKSARVFDPKNGGHWHIADEKQYPPLKLWMDTNDSDELTMQRREIQWFIEHCECSNLRVRRAVIKGDRSARIKLPVLANASEICGAIQAAQVRFDPLQLPPITTFDALLSIRWDSSKCKVIFCLFEQGCRPISCCFRSFTKSSCLVRMKK